MSVNTEALCTLLKQAETVVWSLKDGVHTISDLHVIVKFREIPRELKAVMLSIFLQDIEDGESLCYRDGGVNSIITGEIPCFMEANVTGQVTKYLKECSPWDRDEKLLTRVIQLGDRYVLVQEKYVQLTTDRNVVGFKEDDSLIFLGDGAISIFPFRVFGGSVQTEMNEITGYFDQ